MGTKRRTFGGIRKLSSGRWQAAYSHDGVRVTAPDTFDSQADAAAWLTVQEGAILDGRWKPAAKRAAGQTLDRFGREWIATNPRLKASTRELYASEYARHLGPYLGHLPLAAITPALVRTWLDRLGSDMREAAAAKRAVQAERAEVAAKRAGAAAARRGATAAEVARAEAAVRRRRTPRQATRQDGSATVARAFRLLRAILNAAQADGLVTSNPCAGMGPAGRADADADERPTLSAAEVAALADSVPERYRALVLLLAWGALRLGEACALRRADVDLTPGGERVRIAERVYWLDGEKRWDYAPPKSRAGRRTVPLPRHVADALADHLDRFAGPDSDSLVFTTRTGAVALRVAQLSITRRLDALGRSDVRVHDLRHTGQLLAAYAGRDTSGTTAPHGAQLAGGRGTLLAHGRGSRPRGGRRPRRRGRGSNGGAVGFPATPGRRWPS